MLDSSTLPSCSSSQSGFGRVVVRLTTLAFAINSQRSTQSNLRFRSASMSELI